MIVLDASVLVDLLLGLPPSGAIRKAFRDLGTERLAAPHLIDVEVGQVLRRHVLAGQLSVPRARQALDDLSVLPIERYPMLPLMDRAFALRRNVTIYDGVYLVLAEALGAILWTRDAGVRAVPGCRAVVRVFA